MIHHLRFAFLAAMVVVLISLIVFIFGPLKIFSSLSKLPYSFSLIGQQRLQTNLQSLTAPDFFQINDELRFLHSAYLDDRFNDTFIRLLGMQNLNLTSKLRCRVYYDGGSLEVETEDAFPIFREWPYENEKLHGYIYIFRLPSGHININLESVSVFVSGSTLETRIPLFYSKTPYQKKSLALCVKAIWGQVDPVRLVEWVEFNRILGVEKIALCDRSTTGAAFRVLQYYINQKFMELFPCKFLLNIRDIIQEDPAMRKREYGLMEQAYLVTLNDCMYHQMKYFRYIMVIDIDEVITPSEEECLVTMAERGFKNNPGTTAIVYPTAWHVPQLGPVEHVQVPRFLYMQQYLKRSPIDHIQPKPIVRTEEFVTINWHSVTSKAYGNGTKRGFNRNVYVGAENNGYVHHFPKICKLDEKWCHEVKKIAVVDEVIPRYKDRVLSRVKAVMEELKLKKE